MLALAMPYFWRRRLSPAGLPVTRLFPWENDPFPFYGQFLDLSTFPPLISSLINTPTAKTPPASLQTLDFLLGPSFCSFSKKFPAFPCGPWPGGNSLFFFSMNFSFPRTTMVRNLPRFQDSTPLSSIFFPPGSFPPFINPNDEVPFFFPVGNHSLFSRSDIVGRSSFLPSLLACAAPHI